MTTPALGTLGRTAGPMRLGAVAAVVVAVVAVIGGPNLAAVGAIVALFAWLTVSDRVFSVTGYACFLGIYYWMGLANPFDANVHQVAFSSSTSFELVALVVGGIGLVWLGSRWGHRSATRELHQALVDQVQFINRLYLAAYVALGFGCAIAILCYLRFGVPALSGDPDAARTAFIGHLSPFSYYQWLLIEVGFGLATLAAAKDTGSHAKRRRTAVVVTCALALVLVSGVSSRVTIGTPLMIAAVVWWSQGRRLPWLLIGTGVTAAVAVVGLVWLFRLQAFGTITLYDVDFDLGGGFFALLRSTAAALTIFARTSVEVFGMFVQGSLPKLHGEIALMSVISLLPGHHPGLGLFHVSALLGYDPVSGTTVSLFGGMFADFGVGGVLVLSPALGWLLGFLERRSEMGMREYGLYYGIVLAYYINMIYGGQLLDVTLLWKLWLASIFLSFVRTGTWSSTRTIAGQLLVAGGLYAFGMMKLFTG